MSAPAATSTFTIPLAEAVELTGYSERLIDELVAQAPKLSEGRKARIAAVLRGAA